MNWPHPELAEVSSADQTRINLNPTDDYKQKQNAGKSFWKRRRTKETFTRVSQPPLLVTASLAFLATFSPKLSFKPSPGLWISLSPETAADQHADLESQIQGQLCHSRNRNTRKQTLDQPDEMLTTTDRWSQTVCLRCSWKLTRIRFTFNVMRNPFVLPAAARVYW